MAGPTQTTNPKDTEASLESFATLCAQTTASEQVPMATRVVSKIPLYAGPELYPQLAQPTLADTLAQEWANCLRTGPGVFVIQKAYEDAAVLDAMTACFASIIAEEKAAGQGQGDHFGSNERIWNSIQKTGIKNPELFIPYYGNPFLALASRAWLGPHYQLTAQVNIVKPGSPAQSPHRDYHLGFQSHDTIARFPLHAQVMSQFLTLQGSIVHNDMPVESGPTQLLPFSHQFAPGYQTFREPDFTTFFQQHAIQLPLQKGDLVFFNPALYHAAGSNSAGHDRTANLVQVSSAFGRTMETVNHLSMIEAVYPHLLQAEADPKFTPRLRQDTLTALTNAYAFPTNLDRDPPLNGNAPATQFDLVSQALESRWEWAELKTRLTNHADCHRA